MEYATTLLITILGGLMLGVWLHNQFGVSEVWTIILAIVGLFMGIGILYKRSMYPELYQKTGHTKREQEKSEQSKEKK